MPTVRQKKYRDFVRVHRGKGLDMKTIGRKWTAMHGHSMKTMAGGGVRRTTRRRRVRRGNGLFDSYDKKRIRENIFADARKRGVISGSGFFGSLWDGIKKAVKIVGPIASMIPGPIGTVAKVVTGASKMLGNGVNPPKSLYPELAAIGMSGGGLSSEDQARKKGYNAVMKAVQQIQQ